ncbi:MAG: inositol monophosphatase family protein [Polyangiaceae bacterium]
MTLSKAELAELSKIAASVADEAADILMEGYRSRPHADEKGRADLVTEFDRRSEAHVTERLLALTPEIEVVGEEDAFARSARKAAAASGESTPRPPSSSARKKPRGLTWYVDPLDGTTNFVHGHPFFCVSIGLMQDEEPVAGAIVAPVLNLRYRAVRPLAGEGEALRNDERCAVSPVASLARSLVGTGFPTNRDTAPDNNFGSFVEVKRAAQAVRRCGAAAIDLCFVADGTYEGYWERRVQTWDVCAGSALVLAAGGRVTAIDGGPPRYHQGRVLATNGKIHDELLQAILRGEKRVF